MLGLMTLYIFLGGCNESSKVKKVPPSGINEGTTTVVVERQKEQTSMPNPNVIVDGIQSISTPTSAAAAAVEQGTVPAQFLVVTFFEGQSSFLDMSQSRSTVWAEVLESLAQENQPAYVEIDPETNVIEEILIPITVTVGEIRPTGEGKDVEVELIISHAKHFLRGSHNNFQKLREILQDAQKKGTHVLVTESDENDIIDVRPIGGTVEGGQK